MLGRTKKILIVTDIHPVLLTRLSPLGFEFTYLPGITKAEAMALLPDFHGIIVRTQFPIDRPFLEKGSLLEFIGRAGAGMDNIDVGFAESKGIACLNAPEGNRDAVAEHALGLLLSINRHLPSADLEVRHGLWDRGGNRGLELAGKTIGIMGYGNTGSTLAKKLRGFDAHVIAYDKYKTRFSSSVVQEASLDDFYAEADILTLHIPLTGETLGMVNQSFLDRFLKPIVLINTARGELVDMDALIAALKTGKLTGAGLDVLPTEKFPELTHLEWFKELINFKQVVLSPHVAGWTEESYRKISEVLAKKIDNFYSVGDVQR